jgi:hypothetical protein
MTAWEYLFLEILGDKKGVDPAQNMRVTTSDGRWQNARIPTNVVGLVNQLGSEGWEMVNSSGTTVIGTVGSVPLIDFSAVFKRPKP